MKVEAWVPNEIKTSDGVGGTGKVIKVSYSTRLLETLHEALDTTCLICMGLTNEAVERPKELSTCGPVGVKLELAVKLASELLAKLKQLQEDVLQL